MANTMTLSVQAYRNMLIQAVKAGKITPRRAARVFNQANENFLKGFDAVQQNDDSNVMFRLEDI